MTGHRPHNMAATLVDGGGGNLFACFAGVVVCEGCVVVVCCVREGWDGVLCRIAEVDGR